MRITYLSNTAIPSDVASSIQIVKMCEAFTKTAVSKSNYNKRL